MRIGCLGLSANPPHLGHLNAAIAILKSGLIDAVWFIPSFEHPFGKKDAASWEDRVNMGRLLEDSRLREDSLLDISVSLAECEMTESGNYTLIKKSYTIYTLWYLREKHPSFTFYWCVSSDIIVSGSYLDWHRWDELEKEEMILVVERPGYPLAKDGLPKPFRLVGIGSKDISSTEIRRMVKDGQDIAPYVGPKIAEYIRKRKLYR